MKKFCIGILTVTVWLTLIALRANAGENWVFGESAYTNGAGSTAVKTPILGSVLTRGYTLVDCTDVNTCVFDIPFAIPPDAGSTFTYTIDYETDDTSAGVVCSWQVYTDAYTDGAATVLSGGNTVSAANSSRTHAVDDVYYTNTTSATTINKKLSGSSVNCTGSPSDCINLSANIHVLLNSGATTLPGGAGKLCRFRQMRIHW